MTRRKSILTLRKENVFLRELTDEEIAVFKKSEKYNKQDWFRLAIDSELLYRMKQKVGD